MDRSEDSREDAPSVDDGQGSSRITRRQALQGAAVAGAAVALGTAAGCGGSARAPAKAARRGGTLLMGTVGGGGSGQTYDPQGPQIGLGWSLLNIVYQTLARYKPGTLAAAPHLASGWESNKKGDEWTIHVRRGVEFHNGKTLTAKDVLYSLKRAGTKGIDKSAFKLVDFDTSRVMDKYTVRLNFTKPYGPFDDLLANSSWIVPDGQDTFTPTTEIGTGPFQLYGSKATELNPNNTYDLVRFPHYWEHGLPYLDKLGARSFSDPGTALNALYSGQVGTTESLPFSSVGQVRSRADLAILNAPGGNQIPLIMNCSKPPFNDARVRLAMKLIANRPLMVKNALGGFGHLGNDLWGVGDPFYIGDKIPQRHQDIEQAKSLLKQAGQSNLSVDLHAGNGIAGEQSSALIFGQDAPKAGIKVNVINDPENTYFSSKGPWLNSSFYQDWWGGPFLTTANSILKGYGEGSYSNPKFYKLIDQAFATADRTKRKEIEREAQLLYRDDGAHIVWGFYNGLQPYSKKFKGFVGSPAGGPWGNFDYRYVQQV